MVLYDWGLGGSLPGAQPLRGDAALRLLEESELVLARRDGRKRYNYLNVVPIQRVYDRWVVRFMAPWTEALVSLRDQLETEARAERA